eukprot:scaffold24028_cov152-Cylindrotheca_fusiformis.AAC.2
MELYPNEPDTIISHRHQITILLLAASQKIVRASYVRKLRIEHVESLPSIMQFRAGELNMSFLL